MLNVGGRISIDRKGRFWVCSPAKGAICFDNPNNDLSNPRIYLSGKKTTYMFEDRQGTYWFCTLDDGIYGLPTNAPINYQKKDGLPSENLISVARDEAGRILFGDDAGNLNILAGGRLQTDHLSSLDGFNRVLKIVPHAPYGIWVAADEGIYVYRPNGKREELPLLGSPKTILADSHQVWCGTSARLFSVPGAHTQVDQSFNQRVTAIGKDMDGYIWTGGIEGLFGSKDSFQFNWGRKFPLLYNRIIDIRSAGNNVLWVATPDAGLLKVLVKNGQVARVLRANDFLPKPIHNVHAIFLENKGRIWLATNRGIFGVNPNNWQLVHYDHHDGLANDDVRGVTVFRDTLWAATAAGLSRMVLTGNPASGDFASLIAGYRYMEDKQMNEFFLDHAAETNRVSTLPLKASLVEVDFAGLDYRSRGNLSFECIMTEVLPPLQWLTTDNLLHWVGSGFQGKSDTTMLYRSGLDFGVHMPPGKYQLKITAVTQNGIRSEHPGVWAFVMPARWYSTFWFSLAIWMLIALILYRIYRTQMLLREMSFAVAQFRLIALQAQINPHFIGNCINALQRFFYPPSPTKASVYNATFTQLLRKTLHFSEQTFIRFEEELLYNKHYLELARLRYGDDKFRYEISGAEDLPPDLPFPALFLQPILENATIHGGATDEIAEVLLSYRFVDGHVYCQITDNGDGINASRPTKDQRRKSMGIQMLRQKADTLNQLFEMELDFRIRDLSEGHPTRKGTEASISFSVKRVAHAKIRQEKIDEQSKSLRFYSKKTNLDEAN